MDGELRSRGERQGEREVHGALDWTLVLLVACSWSEAGADAGVGSGANGER